MIQALIFDLDGTLVKTERLKALSYARAAIEMRPGEISETEVVEAFKEVVGQSRQKVATALLERFGLEAPSRRLMAQFGVGTPWQAFVQVRWRHYEAMIGEPEVIRKNQWPHTMDLLREARRAACKVGLATMSKCAQVRRVLEILALTDAFDFVASRDDVLYGKPDPEIYFLVSRELGVQPPECLVIEDSPSGVKAAIAASMPFIAVSTPFTKRGLHRDPSIEQRWIVDDPDELIPVVRKMIAKKRAGGKQPSCDI